MTSANTSAKSVDPDADIIKLARGQQLDQALRLLMQRHGAAVYRYCAELLRYDVDDVHQTVFIQAHRALPQFARRAQLRTWLFKIAHNRCIDELRKRKRERDRLCAELPEELEDPEEGPAQRVGDAELRLALKGCLEELGGRVRAAVLLRYQQGFSFEEMADVCGENAAALQMRVARGVRELRRLVQKRTGGRV